MVSEFGFGVSFVYYIILGYINISYKYKKWYNWWFLQVWSQMGEISIEMMHNPPAMVEQLQWTEWSSINKLHLVNHFCIVIIIGQIMSWGVLKCKNYMLQSLNGASTPTSTKTKQSGRCQSLLRGDLWYLQRKCELFVKCSLSHSQSWYTHCYAWKQCCANTKNTEGF